VKRDRRGKTDVTTLASGALLAVLLYMLGMLGQKMTGLPAPVGMLFLAVLLKLVNGVSPRLQEGSQMVYKFFRTAVTYRFCLPSAWPLPRGRSW
jgi:Na+/citrate or Na+/malate symporter